MGLPLGRRSFRSRGRPATLARGPGAWSPGDPCFRELPAQTPSGSRLGRPQPTFLGNPVCLCPALRPRRNRRARPYGPPARSPLYPRRRLPHWVFRGSMTRPRHARPTLRRADRSTTTPDSLPAAGQLSRTGLRTRRVPTKGFRVASYISSSFPKLSWRKDSHLFPRSEIGDCPYWAPIWLLFCSILLCAGVVSIPPSSREAVSCASAIAICQ